MKTRIFANGKPYTKSLTLSDDKWLEKMSKSTRKTDITELNVGNIKSYPTWIEKIAIMILKETVNPEEACILTFDVKSYDFRIKRYVNGFLRLEDYYINSHVNAHPFLVTLSNTAKSIIIDYREGVTCTISWQGYSDEWKIEISEEFTDIVVEKHSQFEAYLDTLNPDSIKPFAIYRRLSKMFGTKLISVATGSEYEEKTGLGIWYNMFKSSSDSNVISCVMERHSHYTLRYYRGELTYTGNLGRIIFTNPMETFEKFETTLFTNGYSQSSRFPSRKEIDCFVKTATNRSKRFLEKISKL